LGPQQPFAPSGRRSSVPWRRKPDGSGPRKT
jgi:hypothetical protein